MIKLQKKIKIIYLCLITFIGILFIFNNPLMAMHNGNATPNNGHHNTNFETQARILQEMNREQAIIVQQIFNARNNNASKEIINNLVRQNIQLSQRISNQQIILHNAMPHENNRNQLNNSNNRRR
ncbi:MULTISPECIES: SVM family protein [16SrI (Aster yellows group)]|nr:MULTISPECIES: SVM family protein [16SrI (Aster yellows group)]PEH36298.1 effector protein [New Jersey aster yellows phytoplasma]